VGARLVPGASYSCTFPGSFVGNAGAAQTDTITTTAVNDRGVTLTSVAKATVTLTDVPPSITVVKTPDPLSRPEPGGSFRFTVKVTNTSFEPIVTTSLTDDIYGDLNGRGTCAIGVLLAANGGNYTCAFDGDFRGRGGDTQTDTVTVTAVDDDNTKVTATAKATVTLTPVATPPVFQPPPPVAPQVLVRTGADVWRQARLAGIFFLVGLSLLAATWRFGNGGPGLSPIPSGPDGGPGPRPGPGPGGFWFGEGNWFGGARLQPPRGPLGGLGLAQPLPAPPEIESGDDEEALARYWSPEPVEPSDFVDMVNRPPVPAPQTSPVLYQGPAAPAPVAEPVGGEVLIPTIVQVRATSALDAVALDAANAVPADSRPPTESSRRSRRFGGR